MKLLALLLFLAPLPALALGSAEARLAEEKGRLSNARLYFDLAELQRKYKAYGEARRSYARALGFDPAFSRAKDAWARMEKEALLSK